MTLDLTGGMPPEADEVTAETPGSPAYREGVSMWIWDGAGRLALPRIGVEAVGATWDESRYLSLNLAFPDGRVLVAHAEHPALPAADGRGLPRVLGTGPLRFVCVEPFTHWRLVFDGHAAPTTVPDQIAGRAARGAALTAAATVPLRIEVDGRMAAPPWVQGTHDPEGRFIPGEQRFEQLFTATGTVSIDGVTTGFEGGGLRIHRKGGGRSDYADFFGHCWQSALFPGGRAFGFIHYRPRPDGSVKYHEGWVLDGGAVLPARVVDTPWLGDMRSGGEDVSFTLRAPEGDIAIEAETFASAFTPERPIGGGRTFPDLQQGIARYRWDGEESYGMIERSIRR
ncbi:hypothetical protein [Actinomadura rugatobispora]|uniref:DUF7064 domain-containing protein n=1 Tax=Actinomadura rugatobispora TaxID=1994 RepID=A0ABW1A320_9ACTN|nr:hypothetical protein GCM10010200_018450 [Actinomadura rugatobispora]